jgi:hypothetical protein
MNTEPTIPDQNGAIELSVVKGQTSGLFTLNPVTGEIQIAEDTTHEQFLEILRTVKHHKRWSDIVMAGVLRFGVAHFGADQLNLDLEQLEFEAVFVKTAVAINSVPEELRLPNLKGEHYVELVRANIPKEEVFKWGRIANDQLLTPIQLRLSIKEGEVVDPAAVKSLQHGVITIQGIHQTFSVWLRRVGGLQGVAKMDLENKEEILAEINEIIDFGLALREVIAELTPATSEG